MKIYLYGRVQGVGMRPTVRRIADEMGLPGYVKNHGSFVEIGISNSSSSEEFMDRLKDKLPAIAKIERYEVSTEEIDGDGFQILESTTGHMKYPFLPDVGICSDCVEELKDRVNRRNNFPFTNCTECGARFTIIEGVPYDRQRTSMHDFNMCAECENEYRSLGDRRFHAQTISCPTCGPSYSLYNKDGILLDDNPIKTFAGLLSEGKIGVVKGLGGMHIACSMDAIWQLRQWYGREKKPFAVMFRDLQAVKKYCELSDIEEKELTSGARPIVLLKKREPLEGISPGLDNVGALLPYSGIHHVLFLYLNEDVLVLTSANKPGEPMLTENDDALTLEADTYLLHNRRIVNRCDDSLVKLRGSDRYFIRKSRGYVPDVLKAPVEGSVLALGAEENISVSLGYKGSIYTSQYIGDGSKYGVMQFVEKTARDMLARSGIERPNTIVTDLHPGYSTTKLGKRLAEELGAKLIQVQHHHAHAASLMVDSGRYDEAVFLALDGMGFGTDGTLWGGEIIRASPGDLTRIAELKAIPLIGGDEATKDIRRLSFAVCETLGADLPGHISIDEKEAEVFRKMMPSSITSSSMGRTLDTLSSLLGICDRMTYDGEPAMLLEQYLEDWRDGAQFTIGETKGGIIDTMSLFDQLLSYLETGKYSKEELSSGFVSELMHEMVSQAAIHCREDDIDTIGITGGVSYSLPIVDMVEHYVKKEGLELITHRNVPNGDGGISVGQCLIGNGP